METDPTLPSHIEGQPETLPSEAPEMGVTVHLEQFTGPLDLLLYLVRRAEVDITEISILEIADQFISTVTSWETADLETAGDFLLMAATLLEIKARMIAPPKDEEDEKSDEDGDEPVFDPRKNLIEQLLAFKEAKEWSQLLDVMETKREHQHQRTYREDLPDDPDLAAGLDLKNADPGLLWLCWERIQKIIAGHRPRTVTIDDVPMEERRQALERIIHEVGEARLSWLLERTANPIECVGMILALLEAIRHQRVEAVQHDQYGPVFLRWRDDMEYMRRRNPAPLAPEEPVDPNAPKKRQRRPPLFTWKPGTAVEVEGEEAPLPTEEIVEGDEERFVAELNSTTNIDNILDRAKRIEALLEEHLIEQGLIEAPKPPDLAAPPAETASIPQA